MKVKNNTLGYYVIGIDIGGTNFRIGSVDFNLKILKKQIKKSDVFSTSSNAVQALTDTINTIILDTPGVCKGICIGFPGTVNKEKTTVVNCPNLSFFDGIDISKVLEKEFKIPVIVEHEVLLLLTHDLNKYNLKNKDCVIAIYLGTGLGNAIYIHGKLLEGKNGNSGELGHIPVPGSNIQCSCGNKGCIEMYASGKKMKEIHDRNYTKETPFEVMFNEYETLSEFLEFLDATACAIATEINILDPDDVILSGGIITNVQFPYHALLERIIFHTRKPYPANNLSFIRPNKNLDQGILGAALYFLQNYPEVL